MTPFAHWVAFSMHVTTHPPPTPLHPNTRLPDPGTRSIVLTPCSHECTLSASVQACCGIALLYNNNPPPLMWLLAVCLLKYGPPNPSSPAQTPRHVTSSKTGQRRAKRQIWVVRTESCVLRKIDRVGCLSLQQDLIRLHPLTISPGSPSTCTLMQSDSFSKLPFTSAAFYLSVRLHISVVQISTVLCLTVWIRQPPLESRHYFVSHRGSHFCLHKLECNPYW